MKAVCAVLYGLAAVAIDGATTIAQSSPDVAQRLDAIAGAGVLENRSMGIVAAVVKDKDTLLLKAYGKADGVGDAPMTVDTILAIGSDTKQFTAAAILQLRDQGKLGLDDEITKWLPDFDTRGNKVRLRHLLAHTSGIIDLVDVSELRAMQMMRNPAVTRDELYKVLSRYAFQFPTGTMQTYSNSGYWLLGLVIEKASGMSYEDYIEKRMFAPLGMSRSMYCNNAEEVPRRAYGHGMRGGRSGRVPPILHTATYSAGAICSTAEDLVTWLKALHGGNVLPATSYAEMVRPSTLDDGTPLRYAMGLFVGEDSQGLEFIGHDGGGFGFSSQTRWYTKDRMAVIVLTNSEPDDTTVVADKLAAAVLTPPPVRAFTGDASLLVGSYKGPGRGKEMVIAVTQTPQGIAFGINGAPAEPLTWVKDWTFRHGQSLVTLRRTATTGPATQVRFDRGGGYFILERQ